MDRLKLAFSSNLATALLAVVVVAIAVTLTVTGGPVALAILLYIVGAVFLIVWISLRGE